MLKISEFAKLAKTTRRTLIFYDEKGLFSPAKTAENGYRYYEPDQLYQFELISGLRDLGLSLADIKLALNSNDEKLKQYLSSYQQKNRERIRHLQLLDRMLEMRKTQTSPYQQMPMNQVQVVSELEQEFWCTDLAADCTPDDVARLYSEFMTELGEVTSKVPSQLGFLTSLPINQGQNYMSAAFRFIKEITALDSHDLMTKIVKPAASFLSIRVNTDLSSILSGLEKLRDYAETNNLKVDKSLWQMNVDGKLVEKGSSKQQVLQYRILD